MNTFVGLVFYVAIGGFITVMVNNDYREECGHSVSDPTAAYITFGWPAIFPIAMLSDEYESSELNCDD